MRKNITVIALPIIASFVFLFTSMTAKSKVNTLISQVGSILGVQTSLEKQEKIIQDKKVLEANTFLTSKPNPVAMIQMAGRVSTDPLQIQTVKSLNDVTKIYTLGYTYKITKDPKYTTKVKEFLLSWAAIYKATGNSIDESHFQPLFEGYGWVRKSLNPTDIVTIDTWLKTIADKEQAVKYNDDRDVSNWNSHRINIIGQIGYLTSDKKYIDYAVTAFKKQIADNLYPDGSSHDFITRDALHYHCYDIWPLLNLSKTAALNGTDLYNYSAPSGASLPKALHFLYPYETGQKTHLEYVNSTAAWDKINGAQRTVATAAKWQPNEGLYLLEDAYFFDDSTLPLVQKIRNNTADYPSFEILVAAQQRKDIPAQPTISK